MRKATMAALLLLILSVGGVCFAASGVYEAHDQVVLTETVVYGDRAAANGLTVRLDDMYGRHLFWDTTYAIDTQTRTETKYSFSASEISESRPRTYSGISMGAQPSFETSQGAETEMGRAYQELYDSLKPGESTSVTFRLKDYMDYYPISVSLDLPGVYDSIEGEETPDWVPDRGSPYYALLKIRDYFRIPVLEEECYEVSIQKYEASNVSGSRGMDVAGSDHFYMSTFSDLTDDACYFTFDAHSQEGKLMDLSRLPEGYGIYRLPYEEVRYNESGQRVCSVDGDGLAMVCPLDPDVRLLRLKVSEDQTRLLLHAVENGEYRLTVIDLETMEVLQKLKIADWPEGYLSWQHYDGDGYVAILLYDLQELAVVAVTDGGEYELRYTCEIDPNQSERLFSRAATAFDGERLAFAGGLDDLYGSYYTCSFFLTVYDPSGLVYHGEYRNSLSTGSYPNSAYFCRSRNYGPPSLSWSAEA